MCVLIYEIEKKKKTKKENIHILLELQRARGTQPKKRNVDLQSWTMKDVKTMTDWRDI